MPIYNAEEFLESTIISVINQTFKNFELILVDDCSTDSSFKICAKFSDLDKRIIILRNSVNSGVAITRNNGIKVAKGQYIGFIDSDDVIDNYLYEKVYECLKDMSIECLKHGHFEDYYNPKGVLVYSKKCQPHNKCISDRNAIKSYIIELEETFLFGYIWNNFYKREIIIKNGISFEPNLKVNEDFDFNIKYYLAIQNLKCLDCVGYHYAKRNNDSLSNQNKNYNYDLRMKKIRSLVGLLDSSSGFYNYDIQRIFWMYTRFVYASIIGGDSIDLIIQDDLYLSFRKINFSNLSFKQKIMIEILRSKSNLLISVMAKIVGFVKNKNPILFAKVKGR